MASTISAGTTSGTAIAIAGDTSGALALLTNNGTTAVTIDTSQNVGIGTVSPTAKLDVNQGSASGYSLVVDRTGNAGSVGFKQDGTITGQINALSGGGLILYTGSTPTERMRIDSSGNLCIGTTTSSPGGRLTVVTGSDEAVWTKTSAGASSANMISWNSADSGNNYFHGFNVNTAGDAIGSIDYNRAAGLVRYNTTSDATLKNIIGDSNGQRSLEILNTTRIREFAWKNDVNQKTQIGVIAQELHETYKGAVSVGGDIEKTDEEGNVTTEYRPWGVDKTAFTFHLIAGWQAHEKLIQEQQALITDLTTRLTALENK
jgi:hypothetical protein